MLEVDQIRLKEHDELEPMLFSHPDVIEQGLRMLNRQHPTDTGHVDILAVDEDGALVVIELKNEAAKGHLDQGLRYYDWCRENVAWLSNAYKDEGIKPETPPRLILIAPAFTDTVKRIAKYIDVELQLVEYIAFENKSGERGIICSDIDYGQPFEPPTVPTIEKKLEYFRDDFLRDLFEEALHELDKRGIELRPIRNLWISAWYGSKRFMLLSPKRHFFVLKVLTADGDWTERLRIDSREQWDRVFREHVVSYLNYLDDRNS